MSPWLLKTNKTTWLCRFRILKLVVERHSCLKVLATASICSTRLVRNFSARINSDEREIFFNVILEPSLSSRLKLFHDLVISSMEKTGETMKLPKRNKRKTQEKKKTIVSHTPERMKNH